MICSYTRLLVSIDIDSCLFEITVLPHEMKHYSSLKTEISRRRKQTVLTKLVVQ